MSLVIKNIDVNLLNKISCRMDICCIGCGKRLNELFSIYENEPFITKVIGLFDNDEKLWGRKIQVGENIFPVCSPKKMSEIVTKFIVLITSDRDADIVRSIDKILHECAINQVYRYPRVYYKHYLLIERVVNLFPMKRQILFYAGKEPHDNADEIVRYLQDNQRTNKYRVVYLDESNYFDEREVEHINKNTIKQKSKIADVIKYYKVYCLSRYICYENEALHKANKHQKLFYLNHGTIPLKNVSDVLKQSNEVDYGLCPGEGCADLYATQYDIPYEKQVYIMPARINKMFHSDTMKFEKMYCNGKQAILWLPTFRRLANSERSDSINDNPLMIVENGWEELSERLAINNQILIIKKHPRDKYEMAYAKGKNNIIVLDDNELEEMETKLQDLLMLSKALLTDYSGIAFEYMLLDKPIGYVVCDMEGYSRGFSVDNPLEYMPGTHINTFAQFLQFLDSINKDIDEYRDSRNRLKTSLFKGHENENGAEKFVEFLGSID